MSAIAVLKIGGSVLTGPRSYARAARIIAERLERQPGQQIVAVVSAARGVTDDLLTQARRIVDDPDNAALDLLWSTGEIRSVALIALQLQALGIRVAPAGVQQAGLVQVGNGAGARTVLQALRLHSVLADHDVVVAPGFLACASGNRIVSLGRGGSDLTAVLIAAGLGARQCELLKDVEGYFSADPRHHADARLLPSLSYERALEMADAGCGVVQRAALQAAMTCGLTLSVRGLSSAAGTRIQ